MSNKIFRLQHQQDIVTRSYMVEYLRELKAEVVYEKCNKYQREGLFYTFTEEDGTEHVDYNWEALLFETTLHQLESVLMEFQEEVFAIEEKREPLYKEAALEYEKMAEQRAILESQVDINIMDLARAEIAKSKDKSQLTLGQPKIEL